MNLSELRQRQAELTAEVSASYEYLTTVRAKCVSGHADAATREAKTVAMGDHRALSEDLKEVARLLKIAEDVRTKELAAEKVAAAAAVTAEKAARRADAKARLRAEGAALQAGAVRYIFLSAIAEGVDPQKVSIEQLLKCLHAAVADERANEGA